ncbi:TPR-like protein [Auricularia subglabra TFB-10046 SS5]|nr:TPR-like protein [Auricularia subglabra TFB-10046 SS5]
MAAFIKTKLKAARDLLGKKDYAGARDAANDVLSFEPENYNANVFLGLANLELGQLKESEEESLTCFDVERWYQLLAWQGLTKFYERAERWEECIDCLHTQLRLLAKAEDCQKCAELVQRVIDIRRAHGSPQQYRFSRDEQIVESLQLALPSSPYYSVLSALPDADPTAPTASTTYAIQSAIHHSLPTLQEIIAILEKEEESFVTREFNKRRTRLNAGTPEQIKRQVGLEIWETSELPRFYNEVLSHPDADDELRRSTESTLLRYRLQHLQALSHVSPPPPKRSTLSAEVIETINGMVLLNIPNETAWRAYIDLCDVLHLDDEGISILRRFICLFPDSSLSRLARSYFKYRNIIEDESEDDEEQAPVEEEEVDEEALLTNIIDAFEEGPPSVTASRLLADVYYHDRDFASSIKVAQGGLECASRLESEFATTLPQTRRFFNVVLATGLTHHYPPKHHNRALPILDRLLEDYPDDIPSLLARAYVLQYSKRWKESLALFQRVSQLATDDEEVLLEALEEGAWCMLHCKDIDSATQQLKDVISRLESWDDHEEQKARASWRLGRCMWELDEKQEAYALFIAALKHSNTFAPAFTSLGIYYLEVSDPPDTARASKCFQKAFELDAREADAARRLAEGFANDQEWDLVDIVARRTIEGEGGPQGADAHRHNYPAAIQFLQIALRADEGDATSWTRLGEAYLLSGRHAAALKTFMHAKELAKSDWSIDYFIATVRQELMEFEESIAVFNGILDSHPDQLGVVFTLAQTYLYSARKDRDTGFIARSIDSIASAVTHSLALLNSSAGFKRSVWKLLMDCVLEIPLGSRWPESTALRSAIAAVLELLPPDIGELAEFLQYPEDSTADNSNGVPLPVLLATLVAHQRSTLVSADDAPGSAAAAYDVAAVLHRVRPHLHDPAAHDRCASQITLLLKRAVRLEPRCDVYWAALGHMHVRDNADMAQHALIKAVECDNTSADHWASLGILYLHHGDLELANQALLKAQILDPDFTLAWGGQALVATKNAHFQDARTLLEHAVRLPRVIPELDLEFARREFRSLAAPQDRSASNDRLLTVFALLDRYCKLHVADSSGLHLFGLACERLGLHDKAAAALADCLATLESRYEHSEDPQVERQYVIANVSLGRIRLASGDYTGAIEAFGIAASLVASVDDDDTSTLQAQLAFGTGLAYFRLGDYEAALGQLESVLPELPKDAQSLRSHCSVILAQVLWNMGSEESQGAARDQLLECIAANPEDLIAIVGLACMGMISSDDSLVDATLTEILSLPLDRRLALDPARDVPYIRVMQFILQASLSVVAFSIGTYASSGRTCSSAFRSTARASRRASIYAGDDCTGSTPPSVAFTIGSCWCALGQCCSLPYRPRQFARCCNCESTIAR